MDTQAVQDGAEVGSSALPLLTGLTGRPLPALSMIASTGLKVDLREVQRAILYFYPGAQWAPEGGHDSPALDEAQHCAFSNRWTDLLALGCNAFGVSTQPTDQQCAIAGELGIGHPLLCDHNHELARDLGLPTFGVETASWYCRLTLIVNDGKIAQAFYPVSAVQSPSQAIAWMRRQRWA